MSAYHLPASFEQMRPAAFLEEFDESVDGELSGVEGVAGVEPSRQQLVADLQLGHRGCLDTT